jgi:transposase
MNSEKYIGLDVHQATISVAVLDSTGKLVMESILETKAATILEFFAGLRGTLSVTFEEGTWAAWLYDLLKPHVAKLVVCNPRKNALLKDGNKSDRIDAHKLAELLYLNKLSSVYHGETRTRAFNAFGYDLDAASGERYCSYALCRITTLKSVIIHIRCTSRDEI